MSITRHHADWLSLVEVSGPFVSLPVLQRVFSEGLPRLEPSVSKTLRSFYEEWQDNPTAPGKLRAWVMYVLNGVLGHPAEQLLEGQAISPGLQANMSQMGELLRPDLALVGPVGSDLAGQAQLLIAIYPAEQGLDKPVIGKHWKATPATRMMELLHGANVSLGLVTNGEHWMLVYAPRGETTGYASWYSALWLDEPITARAFHALLGVKRFFGVAAENTLVGLLKESANDQQEVTDQLGYQVREAVKVLVQSFDALDKESNRNLLRGVKPTTLYDSALTVMMRLVFLFSAEERGLLHLGKPLYDENYAVSTLQEQLQEVADRYGEEVLQRRHDAWARLLATFRAVHGGIQHQDLLMQAYGGSLFDPDRYPFLEGRAAGSHWRSTAAEPLEVNNRVVLHLLNSLQRLRSKTGNTIETRRVSFRALGVEQIGHVYEGLLDHTAVRATEVVLGIRGTRTKEPEIPLQVLENLLSGGEEKLLAYLKEETGRSVSALRKELKSGGILDDHKLHLACNGDVALVARLRPFDGLIRDDSFEQPWVVLPGSIFVTAGTARRSSGTHYTPPSLTEPIVRHTLEPLVYKGPAEGLPQEQWKLKSPKEILDLKVCDMAMGSGAFLVQACRYLAERLVEAWENEEKTQPGQVLITPDGKFSEGSPAERLVPAEAAERIAIARRVVADRCLYGVDINPMAVEMAKLSMWLITVNANRPFTFLDHAFKCGDSLLGITSLEQLENFSLRPGGGKQQAFATLDLWQHIEEAKKKREMLEAMPSDTPEQIAAKVALYAEAEEVTAKLNAAADILIALELKGLTGKAYEGERQTSADLMMSYWVKGLSELQAFANQQLASRRCLHWPLIFPEAISRGGFDAFVGNPPFLGNKKISGTLGLDYRDYLTTSLAQGCTGLADLCAYFFLRAFVLLSNQHGLFGLIATNTIAQGDTREVGLDQLVKAGGTITRAIPSTAWPGTANVVIAEVWVSKHLWNGELILDGKNVTSISTLLNDSKNSDKVPFELSESAQRAFIGSYVLGKGFVLSEAEVKQLGEMNKKNLDVIYPFLGGEDLNSSPTCTAKRYVIQFWDWPLSSETAPREYEGPLAEDYPDCLKVVTEKVKPERDSKNRKAYREYWWQFAELQKNVYKAIARQERVLVKARVSPIHALTFVPANQVFNEKVVVYSGGGIEFALFQSNIHESWAVEYSPTMGTTTLSYSPSACVSTFPFPATTERIGDVGVKFSTFRQSLMLARNQGLTSIYNALHDPTVSDNDISELRRLYVEMDNAVAAAYGWQDLDLGHGFHETKQGIRFTISEATRREVLDRLLALNHQRHAEEIAAAATQEHISPAKRGRKKKDLGGQAALEF
ncbi:Eco57I restriction-modification methylase domain-containing protein [Laribacter hongkongensis]|uniref:Eco57I restriction-modification methylase domain-containing protein n=1 Tax=Laribacter hongkongensis TaxID=168471 RepID=UPI001EFD398D|nr:DNA methyltransferase [Laribacter hongkongensis]MCG9094229.1 hypothetical protein [Laribacter hongkongensis]